MSSRYVCTKLLPTYDIILTKHSLWCPLSSPFENWQKDVEKRSNSGKGNVRTLGVEQVMEWMMVCRLLTICDSNLGQEARVGVLEG